MPPDTVRLVLAAVIACALSALLAAPSAAACRKTLDRMPGQNHYPGFWVFVCQGAGVDYVRRTRRLVTWRSPNPGPRGAHAVRFLDVDRVLGHGVNWVSVTVLPDPRQGLQDPATLDIVSADAAIIRGLPLGDLPDIPFPPGAGAGAHDSLTCIGVWRVPEGDVPASIAMRFYADGRRQARFRGVLLRQGARNGLRFEFSDDARITMRGSAKLHPDGQGGWQVSCRFDVSEHHYYGTGRHRLSRFSGRTGQLMRHHCRPDHVYC